MLGIAIDSVFLLKKMTRGASEFKIKYPDYYTGKFDPERIEVRLKKGKSIPLKEVIWDQESYQVIIVPEEPIEAGRKVEIVFSNVKNPHFGGTFYFHCQILPAGDVPVPLYLGSWILSIGR